MDSTLIAYRYSKEELVAEGSGTSGGSIGEGVSFTLTGYATLLIDVGVMVAAVGPLMGARGSINIFFGIKGQALSSICRIPLTIIGDNRLQAGLVDPGDGLRIPCTWSTMHSVPAGDYTVQLGGYLTFGKEIYGKAVFSCPFIKVTSVPGNPPRAPSKP
jgi:hypothetical protein